MTTIQHAPELRPDIGGDAARIWRLGVTADAPAALGFWLIHAPTAHPFWAWHVLSLVSLADLPGLPPATRHFPEATHEILVMALDPEQPLPDVQTGVPVHVLNPQDVCVQIAAGDDRLAEALCMQALVAVSLGRLVPDSDWQSHWDETITGWCRERRP